MTPFPTSEESEKDIVFDGIRTHASEETAALMQRLRPLGHEHFLV